MKKNIIAGIIGLLLVVGVALYTFSGTGKLPNLIGGGSITSLLPGGYDQILMFDIDDDLRDIAQKTNTMIDSATFSDILKTVDQLVLYQIVVDENPYNLLFMRGNKGFTIEQVEALGLLAGDQNYEYRDLGRGYWVYGSGEALSWYDKKERNSLHKDSGWKALSKAMNEGSSNVGFLSIPVVDDPTNIITAQFADKLNYTYFVSTIRQDNPSGRLVLQMVEDTFSSDIAGITPKLLGSIVEQPLLYIEAEDILSLFSVDKNQLQAILPALLGQWGSAQGIAFDNTDVNTLLDALEKNIAIVAFPSKISPMQASIHLIFEDKAAYTTLRKLGPTLQGLLSGMLGNTNTDFIKEVSTDSGVSYTLDIPTVSVGTGAVAGTGTFVGTGTLKVEEELGLSEGLSLPLLSIQDTDEYAVLSLFSTEGPSLGNGTGLDITYTDNSKIIFGWDAGLMQESFLGGTLEQNGQLLGSNPLFQTGALQGHLDILPDDQQIRIDFSIE